jgi:hypothetical protein
MPVCVPQIHSDLANCHNTSHGPLKLNGEWFLPYVNTFFFLSFVPVVPVSFSPFPYSFPIPIENDRTSRPWGQHPCSRIRRSRVQISVWRQATLIKVSRGFPRFIHANSGIVPFIKPRLLPSISLLIHYSLIIQSFDAILFELLTASLNKLQAKKLMDRCNFFQVIFSEVNT